MMATDSKKTNWNRPWSTDKIIENAENWSLAGDAALLSTMKSFAEDMLMKTDKISDNMDDILNNVEDVGMRLEILQNEFQSLKNTQYIESRVYEDDEIFDSKEEEKAREKLQTEDEREKVIIEAIKKGLGVFERYYDKVEVSISDSEEDESEKSYIMKVKDLYANRPLPPIIGTEEWYKKLHLHESPSESKSDKVSDIYSESDSEENLPNDLLKSSQTSSELDFSSQRSESRPVTNSTFNECTKKDDQVSSGDESEGQGSLPIKTPISSKTFAEQLAEKLNSVTTEQGDNAEINKNPIRPVRSNNFIGDPFFDDPPPLDDSGDTLLPKTKHSNLFSGGQGLFDDHEEDEQRNQRVAVEKPCKDEPKGVSQVSKGLFDSDDSSDDEIFNKRIIPTRPSFLQSHKTMLPLFDEEPPELDVQEKTTEATMKKKPVGGVSIFGKTDIFANKTINEPINLDSSNLPNKLELFNEEKADFLQKIDETVGTSVKEEISQQSDSISETKKVSLFYDDFAVSSETSARTAKKFSLFDDDELFKYDLFPDIIPKKTNKSLFDDLEEEDSVKPTMDENSDKFGIRKVSLFSESEYNEDFGFTQKTQESFRSASKNSDLHEETLEKAPFKNLFQDVIMEQQKTIESSDVSELPTKEDATSDDVHPEILLTGAENQEKSIISLFNSTPPPVNEDDDWDTKSEHFSDPEDFSSYHVDKNIGRFTLFDNEPPSLDPIESSGTVIDNITRVDTNDSSRRLSLDLCVDQESQDGLFVTKNRQECITVPPHLDVTSESSKNTITDITPSENMQDSAKTAEPPKKLKHNLNIDVTALFPPKLKDIPKSRSLDFPKENQGVDLKKSDVNFSTYNIPRSSNIFNTEKAVSFDETIENVEVLQNVTKDRAKIAIKRRPSTRKGRLEAIRKSQVDVAVYDNDEKFEEAAEKVLKTPAADILPPQAIESPKLAIETADMWNTREPLTSETSDSDIFKRKQDGDDTNTDNKLVTNSSLFDSDGETDNGLFEKKAKLESSLDNAKKSQNTVNTSKKYIFEDSSSEDDLFSGVNSRTFKNQEPVLKPVGKKIQRSSTILRKFENIEASEDPLSNLSK